MFNSVTHPAQLWLDYLLKVSKGVVDLIKLIHFKRLILSSTPLLILEVSYVYVSGLAWKGFSILQVFCFILVIWHACWN